MKPQYLTLLILIISSLFAEISVPYTSDFEAPKGFADETPLSGDWTTTDNAVVITDETAQSGTQSVRIPSADSENMLSLRFDPSANTILFADYYMQLTASVLPELSSIAIPETTALITVQPFDSGSGEWIFLDGDGSGDGIWFVAGDTMPLNETGRTGWHRFTLRFNLSSDLWDAYIDGNLLAINLGFVEALTIGSEAINIYGSRVGVAYLDNFSLTASNPLFGDADLDGMEDAFETENGLDDSVDDRDLDPDSDGLSNIQEYLYGTDPATFDADEGILSKVLFNRTNWYIDSVNGDDLKGVGSAAAPFRSLSAVLSLNDRYPGYIGAGDTVYLAVGEYASTQTDIDVAGLRVEGTLGDDDVPATQVGNIKVTADNITLKNLNFHNASLTLQNTTAVTVSNNVFSGSVDTSLSLIGASENVIRHNRFASAIYQSVYIYWDSATKKTSNDNQFLNNYFTHRPADKTHQIIYCNWTAADASSISVRNRFINCAFEETASGLLKKVIYDGSTWWMVVDHECSIRFEDCYFKRADRATPFSEFVIVAGDPDFEWRWDELTNDAWVSSNDEYAITGDYKGWNHAPRVQFIDGNENDLAVETSHSAGLLSNGNSAPVITSAAITSVDVDSVYHYTVTVSDMDSSDIVTLSAAQLPDWLSFDGTTLSGTPTAAEIGTHTVEIVATDFSGATDTQTFTLSVNAVDDDNAVIDFDYVSIFFDQDYAYSHAGPVSGTVRGLSSGYADYSIRVYSKTDADYPIGTVDINSDGSWSISSAGTGQKIARLYSKADMDTALPEVYGEGETASGTYVNQNDAPGLDFIASPVELEEGAGEQTLALTGIQDGDHGTQAITINAVSDNPGLIADPVITYDPINSLETATLSYTPQSGGTGTATITLTLRDDGGTEIVGGIVGWKRLAGKDTKTVSFQVFVGSSFPNNNAPTIISTAITSVDADSAYNYTINATDTDAGDTVTLNILQLPEWLSFDGTTLSGTPTSAEIGTHTVEIVATDFSGAPDTQTFILTVNTADVDDTAINFDYVSILFDQDYAYSHTGPVSGTVRGIGSNYSDYSIQVYSKTDADYLIGTVDINPDGSWSIGLVGAGQKIARLYSKANMDAALSEVYGEGETASGNYVNQNDAPTLDFITSPITVEANSSWQTIVLTGIHDGDHGTQNISISAVSEDTNVVYNPVINYDPASDPTTATLRYAPRPGVARRTTINLTLQDDGGTETIGGTVGWKRLAGKDTRTFSFEIIVGSGGTHNTAPRQVKLISDISVGKDAAPGIINLYDAFEDAETADKDLTFDITNTNSTFVTSEINSGALILNYPNTSGTSTITITVTDNDPNNPFSTSRAFKVTVKIDVDNDGLSDEFEQTIIDFDPNDNITSLEDVLPDADFDGDGYNNLIEFNRGFSPTDNSEIPDWVAGTYRLVYKHFLGKKHIRFGFRDFMHDGRIYLTSNYNQTVSGSCDNTERWTGSYVKTYLNEDNINTDRVRTIKSSSGYMSPIRFPSKNYRIEIESARRCEKIDIERIWYDDEGIKNECSSVVVGETILSDEYTVADMISDAMSKPYGDVLSGSVRPRGLTQVVAGTGVSPNKNNFGYSKGQVTIEWSQENALVERYPIKKYLLFQPADDEETILNEREFIEIVDTLEWSEEPKELTIEPNYYRNGKLGVYYVIDLNVSPDFNRDGEIDDTDYAIKAKGGEPAIFKFWVNDDDDSGEFGKEGSPGQTANADANNSQVDGVRDTVDLFALKVDFNSLTKLSWASIGVIEDFQDIEIKLSGSSLRLVDFYDSSTRYPSHNFLNLETSKIIALASTTPISTSKAAPTPLSRECLDKIKSNGGVIALLFEGVDDGNLPNDDPLVFHIYYKGRKLVEIEQKIRLDHVENMSHNVDLTKVVSEYGETPSGTVSIQAAAPNWPDEMTNDKTFVFVHGYNVDAEAARGWHAEVFKRLHQMGSNARFVAVTWDGATKLDYHKAVFQAFQTGDSLNDALSAYTGDVTVAAHSLGNIVVSHAIQDGDFRPDRYYMINAAVPIEAYNFSDIEPDMVEKDWEDEFEDGLEHLFSATWHQLFEGTEDNRQFLKWRNRFEAVAEETQLHNFYSPGEEVLDKREGVNSASAIGSLFRQGFDFSRGAWKAQELVKGVRWSESIAAAFMQRGQAGWDDGMFLGKYPLTSKEKITDEQLMTKPYFDNFREDDLTSLNPTVASAKAAEKQVQYDLLARGIPALSYAAAVDRVEAEDKKVTNFDMETDGRTKDQWLTEGHRGKASGEWLHSDFRNVALPYVYQMYLEMINQGNLNEN